VVDAVGGTPVGFQSFEVNELAPMSLTVPPSARFTLITAEGRVRWRDDGEAPTTRTGHVLDDAALIYSGPLTTIQFVAEAGRTAILSVSYYR
jgi:hypothetical protein